MILISAVATTASRVAREWNGNRARPARTHVKRRAPEQAVPLANGTDTTRDLYTLHTYSFWRPHSVEHNFFRNPRFIYENLGKFTKRCDATDSNNMRIASCTLTFQKIAESLQQ